MSDWSGTLEVFGEVKVAEGICLCGCGKPTGVVKRADPVHGYLKGQHYRYFGKHGSRRKTPSYIVIDCGYTTPCWVWLGFAYGKKHVYGQMHYRGRAHMAHRVYKALYTGQEPEDLPVQDHLCRVELCVCPWHVDDATQTTNTQRGDAAKLNWDIVCEILLSDDTPVALAKLYGVHPGTIRKVLNNKSWVT